ncbi:MAG TPA: FecR family protein, partial [Candidatus Methylomirabilis sp.]|nr:FecR family protein [Candidatus Methylomirabilis sp.]
MKRAVGMAVMVKAGIRAGLVAGFLLAPGIARTEELQIAEEDFGGTFARVRYLEDGLTVRRALRGEQVEAGLNAPITPGDLVLADQGRVEIVLADGSVVWVEDGSRVEFTSLADVEGRYEKTNLLGLQEGIIRIEATDFASQDRTFRIDSTAGTVYLLSGGSYRVEWDGRVLEIAVFRGSAELSGDGGSKLVGSGYSSRVVAGRGAEEPLRFNTARLDDFDEFCAERLEAYLRNEEIPNEVEEQLPQEVQPYASELSFYGAWHHAPVYGWVWRPAYYGSWAPYWNGYWSWCSTGWVWVSYDAWGWAPYRYGRWDHMVDIGWVWIPGGVWRGAWVSFAVGTGYVGWCPLNYWNRAVFHGGHGGHPGYVNPHHLDGRGWRFVPTGQFSARDLARHSLRPDRIPGETK